MEGSHHLWKRTKVHCHQLFDGNTWHTSRSQTKSINVIRACDEKTAYLFHWLWALFRWRYELHCMFVYCQYRWAIASFARIKIKAIPAAQYQPQFRYNVLSISLKNRPDIYTYLRRFNCYRFIMLRLIFQFHSDAVPLLILLYYLSCN